EAEAARLWLIGAERALRARFGRFSRRDDTFGEPGLGSVSVSLVGSVTVGIDVASGPERACLPGATRTRNPRPHRSFDVANSGFTSPAQRRSSRSANRRL